MRNLNRAQVSGARAGGLADKQLPAADRADRRDTAANYVIIIGARAPKDPSRLFVVVVARAGAGGARPAPRTTIARAGDTLGRLAEPWPARSGLANPGAPIVLSSSFSHYPPSVFVLELHARIQIGRRLFAENSARRALTGGQVQPAAPGVWARAGPRRAPTPGQLRRAPVIDLRRAGRKPFGARRPQGPRARRPPDWPRMSAGPDPAARRLSHAGRLNWRPARISGAQGARWRARAARQAPPAPPGRRLPT